MGAACPHGSQWARVDLPAFQRGDTGGDGLLDVSDAVCILGFLFRGDPARLGCAKASDLDDGATSTSGTRSWLLAEERGDRRQLRIGERVDDAVRTDARGRVAQEGSAPSPEVRPDATGPVGSVTTGTVACEESGAVHTVTLGDEVGHAEVRLGPLRRRQLVLEGPEEDISGTIFQA